MNYQYIEQLLERYFECQTTLQEEQILRSFFAQEDVPGHLLQYAELFQFEAEACKETLGDDFDQRIIVMVEGEEKHEEKAAKARVVRLMPRFTPFFKAAALVAIALTIGNATERALSDQAEEGSEDAVAVDPYIKSGDIRSTLRVKDVSQAETKTASDTIFTVVKDNF